LAEHPADRELFHARLRPHRSLSASGFRALMLFFAAACFLVAIPFVVMGAWPIFGFMGLDVALVYWAFRASYRDARAYEDVRLTPLELSLAKVSARGARDEWRFSPAFVRLEREEHPELGVQRLSLVSRGRRVDVASFLGPDEKEEFAGAFSHALAEARRGLRFS
jgi:uncharacterized membrane protein